MKKRIAVILSILMIVYVCADYSVENSVAVSTHIDKNEYVLGGDIVGIKLYAKGLMLIDFGNIGDECPALSAGLSKGDIIIRANGEDIKNTDGFIKTITSAEKEIHISVDRNGEIFDTVLTPITDQNGIKRVGMWVRDSIAGVGTVTFTDVTGGKVVTLGHSVADSDTGRSFTVRKGYITDCEIIAVNKSEKGAPGEIVGKFTEDEKIYGYITENTNSGLFANSSGIAPSDGIRVKVKSSKDVRDGEALLYTELAGEGVKPYKVEIKRTLSAKGDMIVSVTDEKLLALTGGIVQGMSGSPIVQNGKLVGAVTHVFVNDPTRGYGIFIENMLIEAEKIK